LKPDIGGSSKASTHVIEEKLIMFVGVGTIVVIVIIVLVVLALRR
jgi:hypothetical protein